MFAKGFQVALNIFSAVALVVCAAEEIQSGDAVDGAAKKAKAIQMFTTQIDAIVPKNLQFIVNALLPFLIDQAVQYANASGFFKTSATI